ncbi:Lumican [Spathaspora sp. JA1]|nr:Lumican [Spathaspora sp. JA1]
MKIFLNQYPLETLIRIFKYAKVENLIQWCEDASFLKDNVSIKAALDHSIANGHIAYNNRISMPSLLEDFNVVKTFNDKYSLNLVPTLAKLQTTIDYCIQENIETEATISYCIWGFEHIFELFEWMENSQPTGLIKYHIEIQFDTSMPYHIDINQKFNALPESFRAQIVSITLIRCGPLDFDIDKFYNLENLWLEETKVNLGPTFNSRAHLKRMWLTENDDYYGKGHRFTLRRSLPSDLEEVVLGSGNIEESSMYYPIPQNLKSIKVFQMKDNTQESQYTKLLLEQNLPNLTELSVSNTKDVHNNSIDVNHMLFRNRENFEKLKQLQWLEIFTLKFPLNLGQFNLKSLTLVFLPNPDILRDFVFPSTLKEVKLRRNEISDVDIIMNRLPSTLTSLDISHNPINWRSCIPNFKRFSQLKFLGLDEIQSSILREMQLNFLGLHQSLDEPQVNYLEHFQFPDSIEKLSLKHNNIPTLENIAFPKKLERLYLNHNPISSLVRPPFPTSLKVLHLEHSHIYRLDLTKNAKGEDLKIVELKLNNNDLEDFGKIQLPKTLQNLELNNCYFESIHDYVFPASLIELSISTCNIKTLRNVSWESGSQLKYVCFRRNELREINLKFPPSVQSIQLAGNRISYIDPNTFDSLDCLQTLNLCDNKLESFNYNFNIKSLRFLDLSENDIKNVDLTFPPNSNTELRAINLDTNLLKKITPSMIGHGRGNTFHNKLLEVSVIENEIEEKDVNPRQFPDSLQCLFIFLNQYPLEILIRIFKYARVENIIQWCEDADFLKDNVNIKAALDYSIANGHIAYNNRIIRPSLLESFNVVKTFNDSYSLNLVPTLAKFQTTIDYCIQENIQTEATISYYIRAFEHIFELFEWMENSRPTRLIKYHVEIEFDNFISHHIDINQEFNALPESFRAQIGSITLIRYPEHLDFDIDKFHNLENLWLGETEVTLLPTFNSKAHLKRMWLTEKKDIYGRGYRFYLSLSLPSDLEEMVLGNGIIYRSSTNYPIPQNLKSIKIFQTSDSTEESQYTKLLLEQNLPNLTELSVSCTKDVDNNSIDVNHMLFCNRKNFEQLKQLQWLEIFDLEFPLHLEQLNLKSLTLAFLANPDILGDFVFPSTLKEVKLRRNKICDVGVIMNRLPSTLTSLDLSHNLINWGSCIPNFKRFYQLKFLGVDETEVYSLGRDSRRNRLSLRQTLDGPQMNYLEQFQFPDSIEKLSLKQNNIPTLENISFPKKLESLYLNNNPITSLVRPTFPTSLKVLHLDRTSLYGHLDLTKNAKGEDLKIVELKLNNNDLEDFGKIQLPKTLQNLELNTCKFESIHDYVFPASLIELSISRGGIKTLRNVSWESGSQLKYVSFAGNRLKEINLKFPPSVESIQLPNNNISYIDPNTFDSLDCLQTLNLSTNKLETFNYNFNIRSLRFLDLSYNDIKNVDLTFPPNSNTELRAINLDTNLLKKITPSMIGHGRGNTFHSKLVEVSVIGNVIEEKDVNPREFPDSLQCLFVKARSRRTYETNNMILNSLCQSKDGHIHPRSLMAVSWS